MNPLARERRRPRHLAAAGVAEPRHAVQRRPSPSPLRSAREGMRGNPSTGGRPRTELFREVFEGRNVGELRFPFSVRHFGTKVERIRFV